MSAVPLESSRCSWNTVTMFILESIISWFLSGPADNPYLSQFAGCFSSVNPCFRAKYPEILSVPLQSPSTIVVSFGSVSMYFSILLKFA